MPDSAPPAAADPVPSPREAALQALLLRMRHRTDFPALSESVASILRTAASDRESLADLTHEILKDVALTQKLLRLVNSVQFAHYGQGAIATVSRAVSLVGFNTVRNMALSLVMLDQMEDKAHARQMQEEFVRALMAGAVATELAPGVHDGEGAFLGAMFQNLGRMLACFYFQDETGRIAALRDAPDFRGGEPAASAQVLGLPYEDLGVGVARAWGLPDTLQRAMRRPDGPPPPRGADDPVERLRWIGAAANDVALAALAAAEDRPALLREAARRYAAVVPGGLATLEKAAEAARQKTLRLTDAMQLQVEAGSAAARLLQPEPAADAPPPEPRTVEEKRRALAAARAARHAPPPPVPAEVLTAGVQEIVDAMAGSAVRVDDVVRMVMETMLRGLGLRRVVFCLRDAKTDTMAGRFALGEGHQDASRLLRFPQAASGDLFAAVCRRGGDLLMADLADPAQAQRLPTWYRAAFAGTGAFVLLPLVARGQPFALLYADHAKPDGIVLDERGFALLRTLRNQALMAFRQGG